MANIPIGDKIKPGQKIKTKSENIPKVKKGTDLELFITSIAGGVIIGNYGVDLSTQLLGYGTAALGGVMTLVEIKRMHNPYRALLESLNLPGDQVPRFIKKRKAEYGTCLTFSLPYGMSTNDLEKKKTAIEQYLNKRIEIGYNNHRIFIKVFEKELEKSPPYQNIATKNKLEFPIGITWSKVVTIDLEEIVHLLIASETGGGKSTLLRGIITSLILNTKGITLYLVDLKNGAEFNIFRKSKIVKSFCRNIAEAEDLLVSMIQEVDRRYDLFYNTEVVNIQEYNKLKGVKKLYYKIVIIDEFADLQNEKGSISAIEVLTAKARACGIHLIISTQRPDSNIVNGRIKANLPCVIGLKTLNSLNSRIVIDENGLEKLRGKGHGILKYSELTEFQAFNLSNEQARDLVKHTYVEPKKETPKKKDDTIKDFSFLELM